MSKGQTLGGGSSIRPALMPADTPDYMVQAWADCMAWAIAHEETLAAFRKETGNNWSPAKSGIEAMIDQSTGAEAAFIESFIKWANVNVWGPIGGV